jgi:hypothetical protein
MEAVVRELNDAKQEILVQAYSFTSAPIAKPIDAHKRSEGYGRPIRTERRSIARELVNAGTP